MSAANSDRPLHEQFLLVRDECETWDGGPQVASYIEVIVRASGSEARARASPGAQLRGACSHCSEANTYPSRATIGPVTPVRIVRDTTNVIDPSNALRVMENIFERGFVAHEHAAIITPARTLGALLQDFSVVHVRASGIARMGWWSSHGCY